MGICEAVSRRFSTQPRLPYSGSTVVASLGPDVPENIRKSLTDAMNCLGYQWGGTEFTLVWNDGRPLLVSDKGQMEIRGERPMMICWAVFAVSIGAVSGKTGWLSASVCNANELLFSQSLAEVMRTALSEGPDLGEKVREISARELNMLVRSVPRFHLQPLACTPKDSPRSIRELYGLDSGDFRRVLEGFLDARRVTIPGYDNALRCCVDDLKEWLYTNPMGNLRIKLDTIDPEIQEARERFFHSCREARIREQGVNLPFEKALTPRILENRFDQISEAYAAAASAGVYGMLLSDIKESLLADEEFWREVSRGQEHMIAACNALGRPSTFWDCRELPAFRWNRELDVNSYHFQSVAWDAVSSLRLYLTASGSKYLVPEKLYQLPELNEAFKAAGTPVTGLPGDIIIKLEAGQI